MENSALILSPIDKCIFELLDMKSPRNVDDLASLFCISRDSMARRLSALIERGYLIGE